MRSIKINKITDSFKLAKTALWGDSQCAVLFSPYRVDILESDNSEIGTGKKNQKNQFVA